MNKKRDKDSSLSEKLTSLIQPKPAFVESDDEDITTADKIAPAEIESDFSADELNVPKLRKLNDQLLEEENEKYSGKRVLRKALDNFSESDGSDFKESNSEDQESVYDESEIESDTNDEAVESTEDNENITKSELGLDRNRPVDDYQEIFSKASQDIEKGKAIKNQFHIWDFLLDCRVKFQKTLLASNQFPNYKNFQSFQSQGGPEFEESVTRCKKSLKHLLNSFLSLQNALLSLNKDFLSSYSTKERETDDEVVSSDSEENDNVTNKSSSKKIKKLSEFSKEIKERHENFKTYQNSTIQKWNDKTRIGSMSSKNFSAFEQSTLKQIEHVLLDRQRLIKRTQTKRSSYHILGQEDEPPLKRQAEESAVDSKTKILQKEIFDDDDFYHQLLSELVKRKANDLTDPVQLGKQWTQLQKIRSKMKKTVDTRASKGRKVRFVVHPKLVNFMTPIDNSACNEESRIELFKSLFGKSKKIIHK